MVLGNASQKLQTMVELAEELYQKITELRERVRQLQSTTASTNARVERLEREAAEQRALLEAIAEAQGVDVEAVVAEVTPPDPPEETADGSEPSPEDGGDVVDDES